MKKLILAAVICIAAIMICGCAGKQPTAPAETAAPTEAAFSAADAEIFESSHKREEGYSAVFKTHAIETPLFTVHMENDVFGEDALRGAAQKLFEEAEAIIARTGEEPSIENVYIIKQRLSSTPILLGNNVFTTADEFAADEHRDALLEAGWELSAKWQRAGLAEYVFGDAPDESGLSEYYSDPAHALTASCAEIYLSPVLAGEEVSDIARKTAISLAAFIMDNGGFDAFRGAVSPAEQLPAWFAHIGVGGAPLPAGNEAAARMKIIPGSRWLCSLAVDNFTINVTEEGWTKDPDEIYVFVCSMFDGFDVLKAKLYSELPSEKELIEERFNEEFTVDFADPITTATYATIGRNIITLTQPGAIWHEMLHLVLRQKAYDLSVHWLNEAISEYFSNDIMDAYYPTDYICGGEEKLMDFFEEISGHGPAESDVVFLKSMYALYSELKTYEGNDRDETMAFELAHGVCSLLLDGVQRTQMRNKYDRSVAEKIASSQGEITRDGNALSYPQSLAMLLYLGEEYGIEHIVSGYIHNVSLMEMTGKEYPQMYAEALAYYGELYGALMAR